MTTASETLLGALDYVRAMRTANDEDEIIDAFHSAIQNMGFGGTVILTGLEDDGGILSADHYFARVPKVWSDHYTKHELLDKDPLIHWCSNGGFPARWIDIKELQKDTFGIFDTLFDYGFYDGVTLPLYLTEKMTILTGMSYREVDPTTFVTFNHIARYAAVRLHFVQNDIPMIYLGDERFKPMDLSILHLRNSGWELSEISNIINVTPNTVTNRINRMMRITGTSSKVGPMNVLQAVGII